MHDPITVLWRIAETDPSSYRSGYSECHFCNCDMDDCHEVRHGSDCPWRMACEIVSGRVDDDPDDRSDADGTV